MLDNISHIPSYPTMPHSISLFTAFILIVLQCFTPILDAFLIPSCHPQLSLPSLQLGLSFPARIGMASRLRQKSAS